MYAFKITDGKATDIRRTIRKKFIESDDIVVDAVLPENPVLAEDGKSLREATKEDLEPDWKENRMEAYGSMDKQLEMQYDDLINGTTTWKDHVASVKKRFPKT